MGSRTLIAAASLAAVVFVAAAGAALYWRGVAAEYAAADIVGPPSGFVSLPRGGEKWRSHFPNVDLTTHHGDKVRFYDDLVKGKIVVINFMYTACEGS